MKTKILFAFFVLACALGGALWLKGGEEPGEKQSSGLELVPDAPEEQAGGAGPDLAGLQAQQQDGDTRKVVEENVPRVDPAAAQRATLRVAPSTVRWLEGQVVWPEGVPQDEVCEVLAKGRTFPGSNPERKEHRVKVNRDGSFKVAVAASTKVARLELHGKYCYKRNDTVWKADDTKPLVIEADLGWMAEVELVVPMGAPENLKDFEGKLDAGRRYTGPTDLTLYKGNRLLIPGIQKGRSPRLTVRADGYAQGRLTLKGEQDQTRMEFKLVLEPEAILSGTLTDDRGKPVTDGSIWVSDDETGPADIARGLGFQGKVEAGRFVVRGLPKGEVTLSYRGTGLLFNDPGKVMLVGGQTKEIALTGRRGLTIAGKVTWANGEVAAGAEIKLVGRDNSWFNFVNGPPQKVEADGEGHFEFMGFENVEEFGLLARAYPPGMSPPVEGNKIKIRRWIRDNEVFARVDGVRPGGKQVSLVLGIESGDLKGQVVNDLGEPVERFRITALPILGKKKRGSGEGRQRQTFNDPDGLFVIGDLPSGQWEVEASAMGHRDTEKQTVQVPSDKELVFALPRGGSISGKVFDADESPVEANVSLIPIDGSGGRDESRDNQRSMSSKVLGFGFSGLDPGRYRIEANVYDTGSAEPEIVVLKVGEQRSDLKMILPRPGRLEGTVHADWLGENLRVQLETDQGARGQRFRDSSEVGPGGRFVFERVPAGEYRAELTRRVQRAEGRSTTLDMGEIVEAEVHATQTTVIRFGGIPVGALRVSGRLLRGGEPLEDKGLSFREVDREGAVRIEAHAGKGGQYSVILPRAGTYQVLVSGRNLSGGAQAWREEISGSGVVNLDLSMPAFELVLKPELEGGGPLTEAISSGRLRLEGLEGQGDKRANSSDVSTIRFKDLAPGEYRLTVRPGRGGATGLILLSPETVTVGGEESPSEVAAVFGPGCQIRGTVTGASRNRNRVFAFRSEKGSDWLGAAQVEGGAFLLEGMPPGDIWVSTEWRSSEENPRVKVVAERGVTATVGLTRQ